MSIILVLLFFIISVFQIKMFTSENTEITMPLEKDSKTNFSGLEGLIILIYSTLWFGFIPVLSLQLAFLLILIVIGLIKCTNKQPLSFPLILYFIFIIWTIYGLTYTREPIFGVRMILKYSFPFLFALFCAKVVRDGKIFLYSGMWARFIASIIIICLYFPVLNTILVNFFWYGPAIITAIITYIIFSFTMAVYSNKRKKNLIWGIALCLPCIVGVLRTDIMGTIVAIACFYLIKNKLKAVPFVLGIVVLGLGTIFFIPSVKNKMFLDPEKASFEQYLKGDIDENNIQTNYRQFMWDHAKEDFYYGHEWKGSGTGRVQTQYQLELKDQRRGGLPHNDYIVLMCDNGNIGLILFLTSYILIFLHCLYVYSKYKGNNYIRACALVAGASILGVAMTMYSDNTVSYSMVTLSQPWGFYGMMLGLKHQKDYNC